MFVATESQFCFRSYTGTVETRLYLWQQTSFQTLPCNYFVFKTSN